MVQFVERGGGVSGVNTVESYLYIGTPLSMCMVLVSAGIFSQNLYIQLGHRENCFQSIVHLILKTWFTTYFQIYILFCKDSRKLIHLWLAGLAANYLQICSLFFSILLQFPVVYTGFVSSGFQPPPLNTVNAGVRHPCVLGACRKLR